MFLHWQKIFSIQEIKDLVKIILTAFASASIRIILLGINLDFRKTYFLHLKYLNTLLDMTGSMIDLNADILQLCDYISEPSSEI